MNVEEKDQLIELDLSQHASEIELRNDQNMNKSVSIILTVQNQHRYCQTKINNAQHQ